MTGSIGRDIAYRLRASGSQVMAKIVIVGVIVICAAIVFGYASAAAMSTVIGQIVIALIAGLIVISGVVERRT